MKICLEKIIEVLGELDFVCSYKINVAGLYCPDELKVRYNPKKIQDEKEFILTVLHEIVHHLDFFNRLGECGTEGLAEKLAKHNEITEYIQTFFSKEIKRYW